MDPRRVAVLWDIESCPLPEQVTQTYEILNRIHDIVETEGRLTMFNVYIEDAHGPGSPSLEVQAALDSRAICLFKYTREDDCSLLTRVITDAWAVAADSADPATLIFISALIERPGFAYAISRLRWKRHKVLFITPPGTIAPESLRSQASKLLDWREHIVEATLNPRNKEWNPMAEQGLSLPFQHRQDLSKRTNDEGKYSPGLSYANKVLASSKRSSRTALENRSQAESATSWRRTPVAASSLSPSGQRLVDVRPPEDTSDPWPEKSSENTKGPSTSLTKMTTNPIYGSGRPVGRRSSEHPVPSTSTHTVSSGLTQPLPQPPSMLYNRPAIHFPFTLGNPSPGLSSGLHSAREPPFHELYPELHPSRGAHDADREIGNSALFAIPQPETGSSLHDVPSPQPQPTRSLFLPLIQELEALRAEGQDYPLRSLVGSRLGRVIYTRAGAANFSQYVAWAEQERLVQLGGSKGTAWISLRTDERKHD